MSPMPTCKTCWHGCQRRKPAPSASCCRITGSHLVLTRCDGRTVTIQPVVMGLISARLLLAYVFVPLDFKPLLRFTGYFKHDRVGAISGYKTGLNHRQGLFVPGVCRAAGGQRHQGAGCQQYTKHHERSRYPVLKIHQTVVMHMARNIRVMATLMPTCTSDTP